MSSMSLTITSLLTTTSDQINWIIKGWQYSVLKFIVVKSDSCNIILRVSKSFGDTFINLLLTSIKLINVDFLFIEYYRSILLVHWPVSNIVYIHSCAITKTIILSIERKIRLVNSVQMPQWCWSRSCWSFDLLQCTLQLTGYTSEFEMVYDRWIF